MIVCSVFVTLLCLRAVTAVQLPFTSSSDDISHINNLKSEEAPRLNIDPRLRRALLRVLTKLEDEDRQKGNHEAASQMAEVMQNIITEEDFIKYFQEQGLEQELLNSLETTKTDEQKGNRSYEEILSYSSEDDKNKFEKPFTFASYPKDKEEEEESFTENFDFRNKTNYLPTIPTPAWGDAIYFQIPEPMQIPDSGSREEDEGSSTFVHETMGIQGPTLLSPSDNNNFQLQEQSSQSEPNVTVLYENPEKETNTDQVSINFEQGEGTDKPEPEEQDDLNENEKTEVVIEASNSTVVEDTKDIGNSSMKVKLEKHEVEFLQAPLLAAFTVQQDQQGLPRRVIPLNYHSSGEPIPLPNNKVQTGQQSQSEPSKISLEEKQQLLQKQLQQQITFLQGQQLQEQQYQRLQEFVKQRQRLIEEEAKRQLLLDSQKRQYENEQRLALARQRQQQILFNNQDNQLETLKELERQRYYQQQQGVSQHTFQQTPQINNKPNINFQKSVDFQFQSNIQQQPLLTQPLNTFQPSFNTFSAPFQQSAELNRVNRHEPSNFVGNFGLSVPQPRLNFHSSGFSTVQPSVQPTQPTYVQPSNFLYSNYRQSFAPFNNYATTRPPVSLDNQLQSLLSISGIATGLRGKPSAQEDLNIVSKVLALGHGEPHFLQHQSSSRRQEQ